MSPLPAAATAQAGLKLTTLHHGQRVGSRLPPTLRTVVRASSEDASAHQKVAAAATAAALSASILSTAAPALARLEGVNRPELLPEEYTTVIDTAGFLTDGEEKRIAAEIANLEQDTGFKLRVLCQNYPETPGLAIRDFWGVDDATIVFVADPVRAVAVPS